MGQQTEGRISDEEMLESLSIGYGCLQGVELRPETEYSNEAGRAELKRGSVWPTVYVPGASQGTQSERMSALLNYYWDIDADAPK